MQNDLLELPWRDGQFIQVENILGGGRCTSLAEGRPEPTLGSQTARQGSRRVRSGRGSYLAPRTILRVWLQLADNPNGNT